MTESTSDHTDNGQRANWWVEHFHWFIFPVWGIDENTLACMCGNPDCKHKGKHPHMLAPNGHNSASNDPAQIAQWWNIAPNANIGVDCGRSGLVVLDCDGETGTADLMNWCASFGLDELPATLHTRTGRGEQFFFAAGPYVIKSMNGYVENNDVKATGGYVVLPCSLHASGKRYEIIGDAVFPTPLPDLLAQRLMTSKSGAVYESTRAPGAPSYIFSEARKFGAKAGYRDEFFNALAFQLKKNNTSEQDAYNEVRRAWELTEQPDGDEFTLQEAVAKLIRVYKDDSVEPDPVLDWPNGRPIDKPHERIQGQRLAFLSAREIRGQYSPPDWLIKRCWLKDGFGMIGGAEKTLKSWTLQNFAVAVVSGRPLFMEEQFPVVTQGPVVVLAAEGGKSLYLDRLDHLCKMYKIDRGSLDDMIFVTSDIAPIDSPRFVEGLRQIIQERQPVLIQLDPLLFYMGADKEAGNVFSTGPALAALREAALGCAVQIGHHFNKTGANELKLTSLTQSGSREIIDHWLLLKHAVTPDLRSQTFQIEALLGARRGFGWEAKFDVCLGAFDDEMLTHDGSPTWVVDLERNAGNRGTNRDIEAQIILLISDNPCLLKRTDLYGSLGGSRKVSPVLNVLIERGVVVEVPIKQMENGRSVTRRALQVVLSL
jgi:hypothetical protein